MAGTFRVAAATGLQYNSLLTTTREHLHKNGVLSDLVFESNPLLKKLKTSMFKESPAGGEVIRVNVMKGKNTAGGSYAGYEAVSVDPQDEFTIAYYPWVQYSFPTAISGIEKFKNGGDAKIQDLLMAQEKLTAMSFAEKINQDLMEQGAGVNVATDTGNSNKNIISIPMIATKAGTEALGGIAASQSYWTSKTADQGGSTVGRVFKSQLSNMYNSCGRGSGGFPDLMVADQVTWENYESSMQEQIRYTSGEMATAGFEAIKYKGADLIWDVYVPDMDTPGEGVPVQGSALTLGSVFFLNSNSLKFYCGKGFDFKPLPFERNADQDASVSLTLLYAQMVCDNRRKQGLLYGCGLSIAT